MKGFCMLLILPLLVSCRDRAQPHSLVERAQFGIFFGGQVQEREQIPFEPSRARQVQGFRLEFREPLARELAIQWEINRPLLSQRREPSSGGERVVQVGEARARAGQRQFDQVLTFKPGDPLGVWNIRVVVERDLVMDRRFLVYDEEERERARKRDAGAALRTR